MNINVIKDRQYADAKLAGEVMAFAAHAQFNENGFIKDDTARYEAILEAAKQSPLFEGAPEEFTGAVASAWASGVADYANKHGKYPSAELLADSARSLQRLMLETAPGKTHQGFSGAMFEAASGDMRDSQGVMRLALFAALILPVALGATTADAVTFIPCERDESDIYRVYQVAGSDFGSFRKGDRIDMQSVGVYSQFHRHAVFPSGQQPDGTLKTFKFTTKALETVLNKDIPIRPGRTKILVNGMQSNYDAGGTTGTVGKGAFVYQTPGTKQREGKTESCSYEIDFQKGEVTLTYTTAPKSGITLGITFELDVEMDPSIIPLVNQKMQKWTVKPSQYALAAEYTIQALYDAQREFGLDLSSQLFNGARNWLSHETDVKRLREILFHCKYKSTIVAGYPNQQQMDAYLMHMKRQIVQLSNAMVQKTLTTGIRGGFAGAPVANFFKSLPASVWTPAPGYAESPYIQFAGTLFGYIRIYEVPAQCCNEFNNHDNLTVDEMVTLGLDEVVFYGRGDNIGDAGLIAGDAVPAIPFVHPTTPQLINRVTLWGSAVNVVHPDHGEDYFVRVKFAGNKTGDTFNMIKGEYDQGGSPVTP